MCSQRTWLPSMSMTQLHRPVSFQLLPHQQQFQHRFFCSKGQSCSGHRGTSGLPVEEYPAGFEAYEGGVGYGCDCTVSRLHGLLCVWLLDEPMEPPPLLEDPCPCVRDECEWCFEDLPPPEDEEEDLWWWCLDEDEDPLLPDPCLLLLEPLLLPELQPVAGSTTVAFEQ
jgi:hypothetical protein